MYTYGVFPYMALPSRIITFAGEDRETFPAGPRIAAAVSNIPLHLGAVPHDDPLHEVKKTQSELMTESPPRRAAQETVESINFTVGERHLWSKNSSHVLMELYISKVTSAGRFTLPKKIRKVLGLKGSEYVEVALLGKAVVIRRLREEDEMLKVIRRKVRKSGLTRARVQELVDEARGAPASSKTLDDAES